jgi:hypothetical protein
VPGLVIGGVGAIGVGLGVGLLVAASGSGSEAETLAAGIVDRGGRCEPVTAGFESDCDSFFSAASDQETFGVVGGVSLVAGSVLLAGGVGWVVWSATSGGESSTGAAAPRLAVKTSPGGARVSLGGTFD